MLKSAGANRSSSAIANGASSLAKRTNRLLKKTVAAIEADVKPIVCVGELLEERESGRTTLTTFLKTQFDGGIQTALLTPNNSRRRDRL